MELKIKAVVIGDDKKLRCTFSLKSVGCSSQGYDIETIATFYDNVKFYEKISLTITEICKIFNLSSFKLLDLQWLVCVTILVNSRAACSSLAL